MDSYEGQAGGSGGGGAGGPAGETGEDISSEAKESGPGLLELSKPSEFRLRALKQQKYLTFNKGSQGVAFAALLASGEKSGLGLLVSSWCYWCYCCCWSGGVTGLRLWMLPFFQPTHSSFFSPIFFGANFLFAFVLRLSLVTIGHSCRCSPFLCSFSRSWCTEPFSHINYSASDKKFLFLIGFHATINGAVLRCRRCRWVVVFWPFSICLAGSIYGTSWRASFILALAFHCRLANATWPPQLNFPPFISGIFFVLTFFFCPFLSCRLKNANAGGAGVGFVAISSSTSSGVAFVTLCICCSFCLSLAFHYALC